jgi:hypothetical protein
MEELLEVMAVSCRGTASWAFATATLKFFGAFLTGESKVLFMENLS